MAEIGYDPRTDESVIVVQISPWRRAYLRDGETGEVLRFPRRASIFERLDEGARRAAEVLEYRL